MEINTYNFLIDNDLIHVKIDKAFRREVEERIVQNYGSLRKYNYQRLKIYYGTLKAEFNQNRYFKFNRLLTITEDIKIPKPEVFSHIRAFFARGSNSRKEIVLPREITVDEIFVEGYALYLGEGDTGFNGDTRPRKLRLTNSNLGVVELFIQWLRKTFPNVEFYLQAISPRQKNSQPGLVGELSKSLDLDRKKIKLSNGDYNEKMKYRVCCDSAVMIDLFLNLENVIKEVCKKEDNLAKAYIRGMMMGEGTVYFKRSRYVRIEMANEKEIRYLYRLFRNLDYNCRISSRDDGSGRWGVYIGAKQLKKFHHEISFGAHQSRQKILTEAANKKLRVNQYC